MKKCPFCAEEIQDEAVKCRYCGELLEKKQPDKWYFKASSLVITFLCIGPFVLPLVWLNPRFSRRKKIIVTTIVAVISCLLAVLAVNSLRIISSYYRQLFHGFSI